MVVEGLGAGVLERLKHFVGSLVSKYDRGISFVVIVAQIIHLCIAVLEIKNLFIYFVEWIW